MAVHGTESRYVAGCRCESCKEASALARRLRRSGQGPGKTPKGQQVHSLKGYRFHGCRCEVCRAANAAAQRRYQARLKAKQ